MTGTAPTFQYCLASVIGPIYLVASPRALRGVYWEKRPGPLLLELKGDAPEVRLLARAARQIEDYLAGRRREFDLPLEAEGTEFQRAVWRELARIPYGTTVSYREVARRVGRARAVRAVGTANGRNPLSIVVPCHRVIAANGTLAGYAGGLRIKSRLLEVEGARN